MMKRKTRPTARRGVRVVALASVLALLLAACGGDDAADAPGDEPADDADADEDATEDEPADDDADADDEAEEPEAAESFYEEGDLVTLIVPFGEGGGTDVLARIVAPYLSEELGIDIQVQNIPGAGSIPGVNEFQNQRNADDGYTWMMHSASSQTPAVLGEAGVDFSLQDQIPVAGFPLGGVIYAREDGPFETAADITGPRQDGQFTYGGQPAVGGELRILLLFEQFESDVNTVLGYDGRGPSRLAWEQGESDLSYDTVPAYLSNVQPLVDDGVAFPLMTFGWIEGGELVADPLWPDLPGPGEVYEEVFGGDIADVGEAYRAYVTLAAATISLNKSLIMHGDAPESAVEEVREAWDRLLERDDFQTDVDEEMGGYPILLRDELEDAWNAMAAVDVDSPEVQWLIQWVQDEYDVNIQEGED